MAPDRRRIELGARGEELVARRYVEAGYRILDRNWRCRAGELDLVVSRGATVVFCEVKTRRSVAFGRPAEAVTVQKQRRLRTLALRWLATRPPGSAGYPEVRFDVACVTVDVSGAGAPVVELIEHAF